MGGAEMTNLPNVHEFDREIPAGKVLLAEYGQLTPTDRRAGYEVIDAKTGWGRHQVKLVACTAGWAIAGSVLRWDNGYYAVRWQIDGATHGSRYASFDEALAHFNRIPEGEN